MRLAHSHAGWPACRARADSILNQGGSLATLGSAAVATTDVRLEEEDEEDEYEEEDDATMADDASRRQDDSTAVERGEAQA